MSTLKTKPLPTRRPAGAKASKAAGESLGSGKASPTPQKGKDLPSLPAVRCAFTEMRAVADLREHPQNPNKHGAEQLRLLAKVIGATGWRSPVVVSKRSGLVVKGHGRLQAAKLAGWASVPVDVQDYADEAAELADMVADNRLAELADMDEAALKDLLEALDTGALDMELAGFTEDALAAMMTAVAPLDETESRASLADRFGVPPFSVLDARQGYWQDRKRAWLALGLQSELGRGGGAAVGGGTSDDAGVELLSRERERESPASRVSTSSPPSKRSAGRVAAPRVQLCQPGSR